MIVTATAVAAILLMPSLASGAVPKANWYWTMVVTGANPNVLLLGTSDGVYRSSNAGKTWQSAGFTNVNATSLVRAGNTIFLGGVREKADANPTVTENGNYLVTPGAGLLATSTDGGKTWRELHPGGLPNLEVAALTVDPANNDDLYALLRNGAVYRSTDGAHSFQLVTAKIGGTPWALASTQSGGLVGGNMSTGAYLSADGKQWQHTAFADPRGGKMVMEYAVDPTDPTHLVMTSYGVVASTDSGKSWHVVLHSKVMFGPIAFASGASVAYAVGFDGSLWRSANHGASWTEAP